ncbi:FAD dependent oxidoreductase TIGR03364 [Brevibacterium sanguinis]|uniref:FAD dependent oxidoreductase TIGR03364 n=2 Tax=Brevibacterium TaxID=1696 RepID=A0A366IHQ1_9MICO|nr:MULTISPECIES: TIGR03364 family FAD-dependent oxidoreductase [Brevibacterium]RBP65083.1 FAD dependent oxidoreductase TIGR03364 [Brevibacterium sanguinis]RBP71346.1 FAD dependent oxidoreductase TIGR03364 [Brevibacterium celere]
MTTLRIAEGRHEKTDVLVIGAGIVGLAHAYEALRQGLSVRVVERDHRPNGASIRNFGHCCITGQGRDLSDMAFTSRQGWLDCARDVGFWAPEAGAVVVARSPEEMAVVEQFRDDRGDDAVRLLTSAEVAGRLGRADDSGFLGGAFLPADLRVDPRTTAGAIAEWIAAQPRADVLFGVSVGAVGGGRALTSAGEFEAERVIVCVGHDLDHLQPELAARYEVTRCSLQMALAPAPDSLTTESAILTGTSLTRYDGFTAMPGHRELAEAIARSTPELVELGANIMFTMRPDGTVLLGDSHSYDITMPPFQEEWITDRIIEEISGIIGAPLRIRQRWQGIYASSPHTSLLMEDIDEHTRAVSVTSGIGMTMCFGTAARTFESRGASVAAPAV